MTVFILLKSEYYVAYYCNGLLKPRESAFLRRLWSMNQSPPIQAIIIAQVASSGIVAVGDAEKSKVVGVSAMATGPSAKSQVKPKPFPLLRSKLSEAVCFHDVGARQVHVGQGVAESGAFEDEGAATRPPGVVAARDHHWTHHARLPRFLTLVWPGNTTDQVRL